MRYRINILAIVILVGATQADGSDKSWQIQGQVIDEQGMPVDDFDAAGYWSANGNQWDESGERKKVSGLSDAGKLWKDEGMLAAHPNLIAKRLPEGRFSLIVDDRPRISVFAVDKRRERGGYISVGRSAAAKPVTITLVPLVRVTAKVYCSEAGRTPDWSIAVIHPPGDIANYLHFTHCGSVRGEISLLLPPGKYDFDVYSSSPDASMRAPKYQKGNDPKAPRLIVDALETLASLNLDRPVRGIRVEVPSGKSALDLGVLNVALPKDKDGIARDYSQFNGKEPPELAITDARGVPKGVKLADFRGKWVLLDFWAVWCGPCVHVGLPELTKFYEEHAADRGRFEILAICNTEQEKARTIEAYDAIAAPIVEKVWAGKQLPFPVLIDGEGKTSGVYGIQSWPTVLLIDPEGHLVKNGDHTTLAEKLKEKKH
jgi:thiol-disulfide isomerase/thioredoxin